MSEDSERNYNPLMHDGGEENILFPKCDHQLSKTFFYCLAVWHDIIKLWEVVFQQKDEYVRKLLVGYIIIQPKKSVKLT
ncbi:MAG: hypothetical protein HY919_07005 [Elusimicrobia bacterium]|nr:hypothetical protein [Elusimicrobiota bacterium]